MMKLKSCLITIFILSGLLLFPCINSVQAEEVDFDFILSIQESGLKDVSDVFVSVDGKKVGLIAEHTVYIYDLTTRRFLVQHEFTEYHIYDGCWLSRGILLLVAPNSGKTDPIIILSPGDLSKVSSHSIGTSTFSKVFPSPDLSLLALVTKKTLRVVEADSFETVYSFEHPSQSIGTVSWNADGTKIASSGYRIFIHDISSGENIRIPDSQKSSRELLWTSDGAILFNLETSGTLEKYDPVLGELKGTEPVASQFECGAISKDNGYICYGEAWNLGIWSISSSRTVVSLINATDELDKIIWDMDDYRIITIADDGVFRVYYDRNDPRHNDPPVITIEHPVDGQTVQSELVAKGTITDDTAVLAAFFKINEENWAALEEAGSWEVPIPTTVLVEGENSLFIKASDGDLQSTAVVTFTYDASGPGDLPPTIGIQSPLNGSTVRSIFNVSGIASDDHEVVHVEVSIGDGEWEKAEGTHDWILYTSLDADVSGRLTLHARSFDGGQYSPITLIDVLVDNTSDPTNDAPSIILVLPGEGESDKWYIGCSGRTEDDGPGATTYLSIDGHGLRPVGYSLEWSYTLNISTLDTGSHVLTFIADDGDKESKPVTVNITKEPYILPRVVLTEPEAGSLIFDSITFEGTVEDGDGELVSIEFRLKDGQWKSIDDDRTWSFIYNSSELQPGEVTITSGYGEIEFVEIRLEDREWMMFNGSRYFNQTIYIMDQPGGGFTLDVRASDGIHLSDNISISLVKKRDGKSIEETDLWLIILILVFVSSTGVIILMRRR